MALPLAFAGALALMALLPVVRSAATLQYSVVGAAAVLVAWAAALLLRARAQGRLLSLEVAIHKHHWLQGLTQIVIYIYWGWYVRTVYAYVPLILAQLVFAYGVDSLLQWSRRDHYRLGFGPWPIVLSINLFLWFRPEWYYWQFAMIALGYLGKELIRWQKNGRSAHIFNPSSFPLAVGSLALIAAGATDITLGQFIAQTQFNPPYMYALIFAVSLPVQIIFGVARVTITSVLTVFAISFGYFQVTGVYLFPDAFISLPVFLGMHLLITDPSTSPRSETGQVAFGVLYGLGIVAIYLALVAMGVPTFYDKLLPVPLLNLTVRAIDGVARSERFRRLDLSRIGSTLSFLRRNVAYTSIWAAIFLTLTATGGLDDEHPGQYVPFWQAACAEGKEDACDYLVNMMDSYCARGSGWSCNELGAFLVAFDRERVATEAFRRSCQLGFQAGCRNQSRAVTGETEIAREPPDLADLPIVLRGSKGPIEERDPEVLFAMACEQGWDVFCDVQPLTGSEG